MAPNNNKKKSKNKIGDLIIGNTFNIKLIKLIGRGACAEVWEGELDNKHVAVKIALPFPRGCSVAAEVAMLNILKGVVGIPNVIDYSDNIFVMPLYSRSLSSLKKEAIDSSAINLKLTGSNPYNLR